MPRMVATVPPALVPALEAEGWFADPDFNPASPQPPLTRGEAAGRAADRGLVVVLYQVGPLGSPADLVALSEHLNRRVTAAREAGAV